MFAWEFLKSPLFKYGVAILIALAAVGYAGYKTYSAGEEHVQMKWDLEKAETAKQIAELKAATGKVTIQTVVEYRDRVKKVTVKGDTVTQYVDRYITKEADSKCIVPKNAVLLVDSAARNIVPTLQMSMTLTVPAEGVTKK